MSYVYMRMFLCARVSGVYLDIRPCQYFQGMCVCVRMYTYRLPLLPGPDNFKQYTDRGIPIGWLFVDYDNVHTEVQSDAH